MSSKTVNMGGGWKYRMWVSPTGWLFVESKKANGSFAIAQIENGEVVHIEAQQQLGGFTNEALVAAWQEAN